MVTVCVCSTPALRQCVDTACRSHFRYEALCSHYACRFHWYKQLTFHINMSVIKSVSCLFVSVGIGIEPVTTAHSYIRDALRIQCTFYLQPSFVLSILAHLQLSTPRTACHGFCLYHQSRILTVHQRTQDLSEIQINLGTLCLKNATRFESKYSLLYILQI